MILTAKIPKLERVALKVNHGSYPQDKARITVNSPLTDTLVSGQLYLRTAF